MSIKLVERGVIHSQVVKLSDQAGSPTGVSPDVQVLRIGSFNHPKYGEFTITSATLAEMKKNFDDKVRGVDIAFDYFHESDKEASGWPTELFLTENGTELWAKVNWTPRATKALAEKEIRYFSPDFAFMWKDPETGVVYKNVLFGGGLTNRPFVKDMAAIAAAEGKLQMKLTPEEMEAKLLKLAEDGAGLKEAHDALLKKHSALQAKMDEMSDDDSEDDEDDEDGEPADLPAAKKQLAAAKAKLAEYAEKAKLAESAKQMSERELAFNVLLSEGKANAAQKEAYLKNDMTAFIKLSQPVNLAAKGSGGTGDETTAGDLEDRQIKLAEEMCEKNPKLSMGDALSKAVRQITK